MLRAATVLLALACSSQDVQPDAGRAGASGASAAGSGGVTGAVGIAGAPASPTPWTGGGIPGVEGDLDCDPSHVLCKRARPACPELQAPSVVEGCWGECVDPNRCGCDSDEVCASLGPYVCYGDHYCGYVMK